MVFLADLTVLLLLTRLWTKISENSYPREFSAQVSQIVLLADLTFLRLITTVWAKMAKNSHVREFIAQVSQIVFLADLTVLHLITTVWTKNFTKLISPRVLCTSVTNRVLSWFDRFTAKYNCMSENVTNSITPRNVCKNLTNRVFSWFDRFSASYQILKKKSENSYLREFIAQVSQIVFLADLTVLRNITTVWTKNFTKLIFPRVLCTSVTNCILTWFDRFMAKYNRMRENVANFISPRVVCTSITNRVLTLFDRFTAYYYCMSKKFKKFHISTSSVHNYHKSCF